jgi:transaldolase
MEKQARAIASWAPNVYVKIPITNTKGESSVPLVRELGDLNLNVTAVMTKQQLDELCPWLQPHHILSVFCGRIMDTGRLPIGFKPGDSFKALWASAREIFNVVQAERFGYDIITLTPELLAKIDMRGKPLTQYSLETVQQFHRDGQGIEL